MNLQEFGQSVKTKYPQYTSIDDTELANKVLEKYPQYQRAIDGGKIVEPTKKGSFLGNVARAIAEPVAQTGLQAFRLGQSIVDLVKGDTQAAQADLYKSANLPFLGETKTVFQPEDTTLGGIKKIVGTGAEIASTIAPVAATGLAARTAAFGASGVLGEAGRELREGEKLSPGKIATTGAISAALPLAGKALSVAGKSITQQLSEKLPQRLVKSVLGQTRKELEAGKDVSKYFLEKGKVGSPEKILSESQNAITSLSNQVDEALKSVPITQTKIAVKNIISDITNKINAAGGDFTEEEVKNIILRLSPQASGLLKKKTLDLITANQLRKSIDKTLGDRAFLSTQLPFNKEVLMEFNSVLREAVKTQAPEGTRALFDEMSKEITVRNALIRKYGRQGANQIISLGDLVTSAAGGTFGGFGLGVALPLVRRLIGNPTSKTYIAQILKQLPENVAKIISKLPTDQQSYLLRALLVGGLKEEFSTPQ